MPLFDRVGKKLGNVAVGINDAAHNVSDVAQNAAQSVSEAAHTVTGSAAETIDQIKQQRAAEGVKKCPGCGQPLNGITAVCPSCGYEFSASEIGTDPSVRNLARELKRLENRRYYGLASVSQKVSQRQSAQTDVKIAGTVKSFVIPNSKQAVFEFMMLAAGNIDAQVIAKVTRTRRTLEGDYDYQRRTDDPAKLSQMAWFSKFEQAFQKAKIAFGNDTDFEKIRQLYDSKMHDIEIERDKAKSLFERMW